VGCAILLNFTDLLWIQVEHLKIFLEGLAGEVGPFLVLGVPCGPGFAGLRCATVLLRRTEPFQSLTHFYGLVTRGTRAPALRQRG
jgi:hypothetical protein